jgi:hypothetical protein
MVQKTNSNAEAKEAIEAQEAIRKRAARQAAKRELAPLDIPTVECVVLPAGHEKISMGHHVGGLGDAHFDEGETFTTELPIALALYRRGYVNFDGARDALQEEEKRRRQEDIAAMADKIALDRALESAGR